MNLDTVFPSLTELAGKVLQPWTVWQLLVIAACYGAGRLVALRLEPMLEERARAIRGNPSLLRMVAALLRRTHWAMTILFLGVALLIMREATWPSRSYLMAVALELTLAWFVVGVASRIIRARPVARVVALTVWIFFAVSALNLREDFATRLDAVAIELGEVRISLLLVIQATILLSTMLWLATAVGDFIERRVASSDDLSPSIRVLVGKAAKIGLLMAAIFLSLAAVGIDLTAFTIFSGAVGVGIGFGLQKVVSNFISGIIILLDKSIKPGDTITLGETFGWIRELRARFVSVVTRDGREYLIPNEDFITQQVVNWSFSDDFVRLDVPFGVSYDSNPHDVIAIAVETASGVQRVVTERAPVCWLTGFGESSLDFVLRFWIRDPQAGLTNIRGKVLLALWDAFRENNIGIPYPHREIIMRNPVELPADRRENKRTRMREGTAKAKA